MIEQPLKVLHPYLSNLHHNHPPELRLVVSIYGRVRNILNLTHRAIPHSEGKQSEGERGG